MLNQTLENLLEEVVNGADAQSGYVDVILYSDDPDEEHFRRFVTLGYMRQVRDWSLHIFGW